ncbi:MucR family transcriptional regulator [Corynebacterium freneyi]|uniref:RNA polymerase sigma factor 70 region 4 type 2 domain-containing protein n=1 Tax=Corynebacterium freneyi TaxID=134034 RepID=A0ABS4U9Q8_9CORY|nr:MucR family transcriptional regulator [Corynebacterium freneyi]MBP2333277.1 hypothetical protein [Corynebacterium freneyi]QXA52670.1 MucR family transcriptional regulator [Corynebacterium freneyi]WJZ04619.1 Transcriptional regulatory protein MucR [Corynebacterium freneyi]
MTTCRAPGCDREAVARGLCMMHYKRERAGRDLAEPEVGSPSGHGRYGVLDVDGDRVLCHECGGWYRSVGAHVGRAHDLAAREYKIRHGLPLGTALVAPDVSAARSRHATERVGTEAWKRLESRRDPTAASHARDEESLRKRGPDRRPNPAAVDAAIRAAEDQYTERDLGWASREDAGESLADIARADGVPRSWVTGAVSRARERYGMPLPESVLRARKARSRESSGKAAAASAAAVRARDDDFLRRKDGGESVREIAEVEGLTESAVYYAIRRARKRRDG